MNKEQQIKEILESVQKAADEALQKIKELEKEPEKWPWVPKIGEEYHSLRDYGSIDAPIQRQMIEDEYYAKRSERGFIAPATEEGKKTLEHRDEWFRFMFKFMTAGDVEAGGTGYTFFFNKRQGLDTTNRRSRLQLGQLKFSTSKKIETFIESFGAGDYFKGLRYIRNMLTGGLE